MGHQINFFLAPDDLSELETRLASVGDLTILHSRSPTPEPKVVDSVHYSEDGKRWLLYLARPTDLPEVVLKHVPAQGYWVVNTLFSPVIELDRCFYDGKVLKQGRLYYVDGFYDEREVWVEKPEEFKAWAKRILSAARKTLVRDKELGAYVGAEAAQLRLAGEVEFKSL